MKSLSRLSKFVLPYMRQSLLALFLLTVLVVMDLSIPRLVQRIIDQGIHQQNQRLVIETGLLMVGISLLSALFAVGNNVVSVRVAESVARDLREALFRKIQSFSYGDLDRMTTGKLLVRLTSDVSAFQRLTQVSLRIGTRAPLLFLGSLILMFRTNHSLSLAMLPLILVTMAILYFFITRMEPIFRTVQQRLDKLNTVLQENIAGVRLVKAFVREKHEGTRFEAANEQYTGHSVRAMQFMTTMPAALTMCINLGIVIVVWAGGIKAINGDITVGQVVAVTNYLLTTITPLILMSMVTNVWARGLASVTRLAEVLDLEPEIRDAPDAPPFSDDFRGDIVFDNVSFRYAANSTQSVLTDINLHIGSGQTVAILGATGAGKSTLINLVPRFYDVSAGRILIDGLDIRGVKQDSLLKQIAVVPQETVLFTGTIRDNISYGVPDASDEEVRAAAEAAQAHDFIIAFPEGYDTVVAERGVNLSGGQKQRIAIARALLTKPKVLILDDSTSSVDIDTEALIHEALEQRLNHCTTLMVAQRISTVLRADTIVVLDKGCIVAEGNHRILLKSSKIYQEIYESQLGAIPDSEDKFRGMLREGL